jgi:hypothetical protein
MRAPALKSPTPTTTNPLIRAPEPDADQTGNKVIGWRYSRLAGESDALKCLRITIDNHECFQTTCRETQDFFQATVVTGRKQTAFVSL